MGSLVRGARKCTELALFALETLNFDVYAPVVHTQAAMRKAHYTRLRCVQQMHIHQSLGFQDLIVLILYIFWVKNKRWVWCLLIVSALTLFSKRPNTIIRLRCKISIFKI